MRFHAKAQPKLFASETAMVASQEAVQIHIGPGCCKVLPLACYFREAKISEIYEGPSEIHRMVMARGELGLR